MSSRAFGNIPEQVHELAQTLTGKFEKSLVEPTAELQAEIDELHEKLKTHGFTVAIVAIKDERGEVGEVKLAVYRIGSIPTLH